MPSCLQVFENIQCWKLVSESTLSRKLRELEDKKKVGTVSNPAFFWSMTLFIYFIAITVEAYPYPPLTSGHSALATMPPAFFIKGATVDFGLTVTS